MKDDKTTLKKPAKNKESQPQQDAGYSLSAKNLRILEHTPKQNSPKRIFQSLGRVKPGIKSLGKMQGITPSLNNNNYNFKKIKIAVLGSYTLKNISYPLKHELSEKGFAAEIKFGGYNQHIQELFDKSSWLREFHPDIVFIGLSTNSLLEGIEYNLLESKSGQMKREVEEKFDFLKEAINNYELPAKIIISTLDYPTYSPYGLMELKKDEGMVRLIKEFNNLLTNLHKNHQNIELLDFERICAIYGKSHLFDEKMYYFGKILLSQEGAKRISEELGAIVNAAFGGIKKVLVVDLDNTLWKGIVGEDGPNGIVIGEGAIGEIYKEIQQIILNLKRMGVLLCISSKNNESDAEEAFSLNKNMILKYSDFIVKKINWLPKSLNIENTAKELNIGLDSFVFLDDNPAERLEVKTALPSVTVIDFPEDVSKLPRLLREMTYFKAITLTEEDKRRHEQYSQEIQRNKLKETYSIEEYLQNLDTSIIVNLDDLASIERITQLINKTNQFNLRTQRYSQEQVKSMMESAGCKVYSLHVRDKFGDLGLTGVMIIKESEKEYFIDSFLLSCRILSRKIENQFFFEAVKRMDRWKLITAEYVPTPKNEQTKCFYESLGFELSKEDNGVKKYRKIFKDSNPEPVSWIKVEHAR